MPKRLLLSLLTPLLLWLSWPEGGFTPLIFIAFIPLLFVDLDLENSEVKRKGRKLFWYAYLSFGMWNLLGTWWLIYASPAALVATIIINGLVMALVFSLYSIIKKNLDKQRAYLSLAFLWICEETLHKDWDFSFPWLNLGNAFAERISWVQWYEYTGAFGGTLWVWAVNILLFLSFKAFLEHKRRKRLISQTLIILLFLVVVPILWSKNTFNKYLIKGDKAQVVAVQPNFNVYSEKFQIPEREQLNKLLRLADSLIGPKTDLVIGPETMIISGLYEDRLDQASSIIALQNFSAKNQVPLLIGAATTQFYEASAKTKTSRLHSKSGLYYDIFNSALLIDGQSYPQIYHKSKLVVGVEMMPLSAILTPLLGEIAEDFGGISGAHGTQENREVFKNSRNNINAAPIICWESDFGEYVTDFTRMESNFFALITNDDWWDNTQGHIQRMHYAKIRAVENRRDIARAANTGISCFIDQRGEVYQRTNYREDAVIIGTLNLNEELTYYAKSGDFLSRISLFISGFLLLFAMVRAFLNKRNSKF